MVGALKMSSAAERQPKVASQINKLISLRHRQRRTVDSSGNRSASRQCGAGPLADACWRQS